MAEATPNYPDVLGLITGGNRCNVNVIQAALAVRPRVVRAGRSFEVILLVQNAADVNVDLTVKLNIPDRDTNKKKGRFVAKTDRLVVGLKPAEVGYVMLPISCLPDAGIGSNYKIGVDLAVKALEKPQRIRREDGGGRVEARHFEKDIISKLDELKQLSFSADRHGGLRGSSLETGFSVMSGRVGAIVDLQPGWTSLWTMRDHLDDRMLLQRYRETMKDVVIPQMTRTTAYQPLLEETKARFEAAGYPLLDLEATIVTKLLTLILEYSSPSASAHGSHGHILAGGYNVMTLLDPERLADDAPISLPHWASGILRLIIRDERVARFPVKAIRQYLYNDLLYDGAVYAFEVAEKATGEDLGDEDEVKTYVEQVVTMFERSEGLDFTHVYLPLILGGIVVFDRIMHEDERLDELIQKMREMLASRASERIPKNEPVFRMAEQLIDQAMMKYGYRGR